MLVVPEKSKLRWLHLTDLHVGKKNQNQEVALNELIKAIEKYANQKPFDLILLTGDLVYSGLSDQYEQLNENLITKLKSMEITRDAILFSSPGNHDLDCNNELPPIWKDIGPKRQSSFFSLGSEGKKTRGSRPNGFGEYSKFVVKNGIKSVDPVFEPAELFVHKVDDNNIVIVSVVTAFFSDIEVRDKQKSPFPLPAIRALVKDLDSNDQIIIIGHHPLDWFTPESERKFHSFLVEKKAIYLHGHEHRLKTKFGGRGLIALGFGAAYVNDLDSSSSSEYRNSFSICELSDSLHVFPVAWSSEHGKWIPERNVPGDFVEQSELLESGYKLLLPTTKISSGDAQTFGAIASGLHADLLLNDCIWLGVNDQNRWKYLLVKLGYLSDTPEAYSLPSQDMPVGHLKFRIKDQDGDHLVYTVCGHGDVLHYETIQTINTELDRRDYVNCIVITLGELSAEAKTLANQLSNKKEFLIVERVDILKKSFSNLSGKLERVLEESLKEGKSTGRLVFYLSGFAVLLEEKISREWFRVLNNEGIVEEEVSELVSELRQILTPLQSMRYRSGGEVKNELSLRVEGKNEFKNQDYLDKCHKYFDSVKYAPLAAMGMKFRNASLKDIYVQASADVMENANSSQSLGGVVSDYVNSLGLTVAQKEQLESQLTSRHGIGRNAEVGAARKLYQRFNNVIVLGDPGSGKTCFVQHEILAYCETSENQSTWYDHHIPIYVSLAEAARLLNSETQLLDVCEIVSARRGISLPRSAIESALAQGSAAFFFDGLDEVGYLERRIELLNEIEALIKSHAQSGCRFVLTSRPAAVQPVDIPEGLTYLNLKGLTEQEIRILAGRVLTSRMGEGEEDSLEAEEKELIDRLLDDTKNNLGIARIARNPLLLTLLVLIYANTGALSAKRHLIYTQAIKTLVSVRGRQTREQQISEADLRTRLGALALSIFRREVAEIPSRAEVISLLSPIIPKMNYSTSERTNKDIVNSFLQEVAEATGLLSIHSRGDDQGEDLVTFMHYSFLEYYAAAGLLSRDFMKMLPSLSSNPRWKDVSTLVFGLLSEQGDVTPLLKELLSDQTPYEQVSQNKLLLALDCAAECDIPPESSQDLLAETLYLSLTEGTGKFSSEFRSELAKGLEPHLNGASARIEIAIVRGLRLKDPLAVAAFLDLLANFSEDLIFSPEVISGFQESLKIEDPVVRTGALFAIEGCGQFRSSEEQAIVKKSLKGSLLEKDAALKVCLAIPAWSTELEGEVKALLDDSNLLIAALAGKCLLINTIMSDKWRRDSVGLEKALSKINQSSGNDAVFDLPGISLDPADIEGLISSDAPNEIELAIRHIPLIKNDSQFSYSTLMKKFRTSNVWRHKIACLDSIRGSLGAKDLITIADTDQICEGLSDNNRGLRIATVKLLGELPDDEKVVQSLQEHLEESAKIASREVEVAETAKALAKHVRRNSTLRGQVLAAILDKLPDTSKKGFGDVARQRHILALLEVCESMGGVTNNNTAIRLFELGTDFKTPMKIRAAAIKVFGRIVGPSEKTAKQILELLEKPDVRLNDAVYKATFHFVGQCRRKVSYIRNVSGELNKIRERLFSSWDKEMIRHKESIDPASMRLIRKSIVEIEELKVAYEEFSERITVS